MNIKRINVDDYKLFVVSYDLREGGEKNYDCLCEMLEDLGGTHILKSEWSVKLPKKWTCRKLGNYLLSGMSDQDGLYVAELKAHAWTNLDEEPRRFREDEE